MIDQKWLGGLHLTDSLSKDAKRAFSGNDLSLARHKEHQSEGMHSDVDAADDIEPLSSTKRLDILTRRLYVLESKLDLLVDRLEDKSIGANV